MNPVKRKEISKKTAQKLGRDFSQVDEIVAFFYRHVQKKLSSLEHIAVNVPNLGTFVLQKKRVENKLQKYHRFLEKHDETQSMRAFETKLQVTRDMDKFKAALDFMEKEQERKQIVRNLKNKEDAD